MGNTEKVKGSACSRGSVDNLSPPHSTNARSSTLVMNSDRVTESASVLGKRDRPAQGAEDSHGAETPTKWFRCADCDRSYSRIDHLARHVRQHTQVSASSLRLDLGRALIQRQCARRASVRNSLVLCTMCWSKRYPSYNGARLPLVLSEPALRLALKAFKARPIMAVLETHLLMFSVPVSICAIIDQYISLLQYVCHSIAGPGLVLE